MIHMFRKEMKKWHIVLWFVFAGLCFSSLPILFRGGSQLDRSKIANVNGEAISFKEFKLSLAETQQRLESVKRYARMLGISEDIFLQNYYQSANPHEIALKTAIKEKLIDQAKKPFDIHIANDDFMEVLVNSMPEGLLDERGRLNMNAYGEFIRRMGLTPDEFEARKEAEMSRQLLEQFVLNSFYVSRHSKQNSMMEEAAQKNFMITLFSYEHYLNEVRKTPIDKSDLNKFYEQHKDDYRVSEKKKARFWRINPTVYAKKIVVDDSLINAYYEKNKSSQFRVPPKLRIRRIMLQGEHAAEQAKKLYEEVKNQPDLFADKAREFSTDKEAAQNGGLTDLFARGTYEKSVEDAAFRLQAIGEVSEAIKTNQGYELVQLAERINAVEEPLEKVKEQIIKTLTAKKGLDALKGDLETLLHQAKEDSNAVHEFVTLHDLKTEESPWLEKESVNKHDMIGSLAEKLFSTSKRLVERGYFFSGESYIIYQLAETEKPFIRSFESIAQELEDRYVAEKAQELLTKEVHEYKEKLISGHVKFEDLAQKPGVKLVETGLIKFKDSVAAFKEFKQIESRAFQLTDKQLVLQQSIGSDCCLVQLKSKEQSVENIEAVKIQSEIKHEVSSQAHNHMNSFIASLERNAKIERFDTKPSGQVESQI